MKTNKMLVVSAAWALFALCEGRAEHKLFGYTEPVRSAQAAFAEAGVLDAILVKEGDHVRKGDVLAHLDFRGLEHDLNIAKETKRIQKMRHAQLETLFEKESIPAAEVEKSRSDSLIAEERVKRIQTQLDARKLRAPFDGVIVQIFRERSESISAARSEVLKIAQLDVLHVVVHVPLEMADRFSKGRAIPVKLENTVETEAEIVFVSPVIDAASRTVRIRLQIPNQEGALRAGMLCVLI